MINHIVPVVFGFTLIIHVGIAMNFDSSEFLQPILDWEPEGIEVKLIPGEFRSTDVLEGEGDWGISEEQVFLHSMSSIRTGGRNYEVRIGRGSQIYSIQTPAGEFMAPQKPHSAEWVDEVLQTVSLNRRLNDRTTEFVQKRVDGWMIRVPQKPDAYFIHQAGTYNRDLEYPGTFYSPLLAALAGDEGRSFSTLVWPQQAHVPNNHRSSMLVYQRVRWVEPGVLEVTNILHNFGEIEQDWMNLPWVAFSKNRLRHQYMIEQDHSWRLLDHVWGQGRNIGQYPISETGGAVAFTTAREPGAEAIALIFGMEDRWIQSSQRQRRQFRGETFLKLGSTINRSELNLQIATVIGQVPIQRHNALVSRYFVALGNKGEIDRAIARYRDRCFRIYYTHGADHSGVQSMVDAEESVAVFPTPAEGRVPLFLLRDTDTDTIWKTTDPYFVSPKPYDGQTEYLGLSGFIESDGHRAWKVSPSKKNED